MTTETTLTRDDTGEFLPVRVADDTPPLLAALQAERAGKPVATWAEFDEGLTELRRRLIDWVGEADAVLGAGEVQPTSVQWAEIPPRVDDLLGVDPGWTGELSTDEYIDSQRTDPVAAYMAADDPDSEHPGRWVNMADDPYTPPHPIHIGRNPLEQAYREREARGWKPDPADYGPRPALPEGPTLQYRTYWWSVRIDWSLRRFDRWLMRVEQWWRRKQAERDQRMGVEQ